MAEKRFRVINQSVEINGKVYHVGDEVPEPAFRPASGVMVDIWEEDPWYQVDGKRFVIVGQVPEPSELESLLNTGHVEAVT